MEKLSKAKLDKRCSLERQLVAALRDKLDALANAQLKEDNPPGKNGNREANEYTKNQHKKTSRHSSEQIKKEIHLLLTACGVTAHIDNPQTPLTTREDKWMIHLDWDGQFRRPDDTDYSASYANARHTILEQQNLDDGSWEALYNFKDYDLDASPAWQKMSKFQSFASSKNKVRYQLAKMNIPPNVVASMNFFDFSEVMYLWQKENKKNIFECSRSKNLKMFEACYGDEFSKILTALRYKPEYIQRVRENMKQCIGDPLLNFHHYQNIFRCQEMDNPNDVNAFSNTILTFVHPHHRSFHFANGYDPNENIVFFGGFDPIYQIKHNKEREQQYLNNINQIVKKNATNNR